LIQSGIAINHSILSILFCQLEFKAKLCAAVGVQSEALRGSWSSKRSFARQLEFKAKLCAAKLRKALNSNEPVKIGLTVY
jgi:hypothetical protein